jgi:hypothetical protein
MNSSETNSIALSFYTNRGQTLQITIPRARMDKTAADARQSMDGMIATGIIFTDAGTPNAVRGAEFVTTMRESLIDNN